MTNATAVFLPVTDVRATAMSGVLVHQVETIEKTVEREFDQPIILLTLLKSRIGVDDGHFTLRMSAEDIKAAGFSPKNSSYDMGHLVAMVFAACDAATDVQRYLNEGQALKCTQFPSGLMAARRMQELVKARAA